MTNNLRDEIARREKICSAAAKVWGGGGCSECPFATVAPDEDPPNWADPDEGYYLCGAQAGRKTWGENPPCPPEVGDIFKRLQDGALAFAALADAGAALEKMAEPGRAYCKEARAALAQIAGRLGHMDAGREGEG